jgi:hypothetical protein
MNAVRAAFASLTAGQRWTASLAVGLAAAVLLFGLPDETRPLTPVPAATATLPRTPTQGAPSPPASQALPPLQLAVLPALSDLGLAVAPEPTTTTTVPPAAGPPPPPSTVCTPPLGVTLTGVAQLDALTCTVIASLPVI